MRAAPTAAREGERPWRLLRPRPRTLVDFVRGYLAAGGAFTLVRHHSGIARACPGVIPPSERPSTSEELLTVPREQGVETALA